MHERAHGSVRRVVLSCLGIKASFRSYKNSKTIHPKRGEMEGANTPTKQPEMPEGDPQAFGRSRRSSNSFCERS